MEGIVIGFAKWGLSKSDFPLVQLSDGRTVNADYLVGDTYQVGDKVFCQDVSTPPEDPDHWLITDCCIDK